MVRLALIAACLAIASTSEAQSVCAQPPQTPTQVQILGVGKVAFDICGGTVATALAQTYRIYVDGAAPIDVPASAVTCVSSDYGAACTFPTSLLLPALSPGQYRNVAVVARTSAGDGSQETAHTVFFALALAVPPVPPLGQGVRP